jgi:DNA invertase Pin-like site-specific DNA recombinase
MFPADRPVVSFYEGIALTKQRGAYTGRKKALIPKRVEELCARVGHGERKAALAREFGISRETLYQYLRQNSGRTARARLNGKRDKYRSRKNDN